MAPNHDRELLQFPQDFTFKIFVESTQGNPIQDEVFAAVNSIVPIQPEQLRQRDSRGGRYQCLSVVVKVANREQIEAIYAAVRNLKGVCYLL